MFTTGYLHVIICNHLENRRKPPATFKQSQFSSRYQKAWLHGASNLLACQWHSIVATGLLVAGLVSFSHTLTAAGIKVGSSFLLLLLC